MSEIRVGDKEDLKKLQGKEVDDPVILENDIDIESEIFTPISKISSKFDGNGYKIKNLRIESKVGRRIKMGLIKENVGRVENIKVKDLELSCSNKNRQVGGIVGINKGIIKDCLLEESSIKGGCHTGGIAGISDHQKESKIVECRAEVEVEGKDKVGGIIGQNFGSVEKCCVEGDIKGLNMVGGIVGRNRGEIKECKSKETNIMGSFRVGGIVGLTYGKVEDSWKTGRISLKERQSERFPGMIVGMASGTEVKNCYWVKDREKDISGIGKSKNIEEKSNEEKKNLKQIKRAMIVNKI